MMNTFVRGEVYNTVNGIVVVLNAELNSDYAIVANVKESINDEVPYVKMIDFDSKKYLEMGAKPVKKSDITNFLGIASKSVEKLEKKITKWLDNRPEKVWNGTEWVTVQ
jgi:predicted Rossmann fold nucleotide-binding protein DprA/Smf involved in DNA uptake